METRRVLPLAISLLVATGQLFSQPAHAQETCDEPVADDVLNSGTSSATSMSADFTDNFSKSAGSGTFGNNRSRNEFNSRPAQ